MKNKNIIEVFFREKPLAILNALGSNNGKIHAAEIAREARCTYSHTREILLLLEKNGIISFNKGNKKHTISLTEKGSQIVEQVATINDILKHNGRKY